MEENNTIDLQNMLFEVAKQKRDYILKESECGTKENSQATEEFIKCMNVYRDLQKDTDDTYLEQQRVNNEIETNNTRINNNGLIVTDNVYIPKVKEIRIPVPKAESKKPLTPTPQKKEFIF